MALLEEELEDSLQFYAFADFDARKVSSATVLERLNTQFYSPKLIAKGPRTINRMIRNMIVSL